MDLQLDMALWQRGRQALPVLLADHGRGSFIGFFGLAIGIPAAALRGRRSAADVARPFPPAWMAMVQRRRDAFPQRVEIRFSLITGAPVDPPALYPPADYKTAPEWGELIETRLAEVLRVVESDPFSSDAYKLARVSELMLPIGVRVSVGVAIA